MEGDSRGIGGSDFNHLGNRLPMMAPEIPLRIQNFVQKNPRTNLGECTDGGWSEVVNDHETSISEDAADCEIIHTER